MLNDDKISDGSVVIIGFRYEKTSVFAYQDTINEYESIGKIGDFEDSTFIDEDARDAILLKKDYTILNLYLASFPFICQYDE